MDLVIVQRDGKTEPFTPQKIVRLVEAAGLSTPLAEKLAREIADWAKTANLHQLTSIQLRDLIIGKLHKVDESAAKMFLLYQISKTKGSPTTS